MTGLEPAIQLQGFKSGDHPVRWFKIFSQVVSLFDLKKAEVHRAFESRYPSHLNLRIRLCAACYVCMLCVHVMCAFMLCVHMLLCLLCVHMLCVHVMCECHMMLCACYVCRSCYVCTCYVCTCYVCMLCVHMLCVHVMCACYVCMLCVHVMCACYVCMLCCELFAIKKHVTTNSRILLLLILLMLCVHVMWEPTILGLCKLNWKQMNGKLKVFIDSWYFQRQGIQEFW